MVYSGRSFVLYESLGGNTCIRSVQFGSTKFVQLFDSFLELNFFLSLSNMWLFDFIDWLLNARRDKNGREKKQQKKLTIFMGSCFIKKLELL